MKQQCFFSLSKILLGFSAVSVFFLAMPKIVLSAEQPPPSTAIDSLDYKIQREAERKIGKLQQKAAPKPVIEEVEKAAPSLSVMISKIILRPSRVVTPDMVKTLDGFKQAEPLTALYENKQITQADLSALIQELQEFYRGQGFLVLFYTPPQDIKPRGTLILEGVISRMGKLTVEGNRYFRKSKIASYWMIPENDVLDFKKMDRSLQSMNENPDRKVVPLMKAGSEQGSTDIVLKVDDQFPLHPAYAFDNTSSRAIGKYRNGFSLKDNNFLSLDDTFVVGTTFASDFAALYVQHSIPLGEYGTRLVSGYIHSQARPRKEFRDFGINSRSDVYTAMLRQKAFQDEHMLVDLFGGVDVKEKVTRQTGGLTTAWDRLRVFSFGADAQYVGATGVWNLQQKFSFGTSPHGDGYPLNSRGGETKNFKYNYTLNRQQRLGRGLFGVANLEGQFSPNRLPPQEQIFLGGANTVRGYPDSDYGADQSILGNLEVWCPLLFIPKDWRLPYAPVPLWEQIHLISFFDYGYGFIRNPTSSEDHSRNLIGVGGGFAIRLREHLNARFEWGVPLGDGSISESPSPAQFHFRIGVDL